MFDKLSFQESIPHDPSPPPPPQYAPGLLVDVFMTRCMPGCPGRPEGTQVARRVLDRRPPTFGYGVVQKLESRYRNNTSLGFLWTGLLQSTDSGLYSFNLVPISPAPCQGNVKIENQLIIDWFNAPTAGGKVSLDPGFHALEIWMFCRNPSDYQHVNYNLQMLGPGDERMAPIPSTRLVHERAESGPLRPSAAR